jgi:hypothetical protein
MTLQQARERLTADDGSFADVCEAAAVLSASPQATYQDLLCCLSHQGLPAELAALELTRRTSRPFDGPRTLSTRREDWEAYLRAAGKIPRDQVSLKR